MFCPKCGTYLTSPASGCPLCARGAAAGPAAPMHAVATPVFAQATAYAGFWRRVCALLLDGVVLFFPAATIRVLLGLSSNGLVDMESPAAYGAFAFELGVDWLYAAALLSSRSGATLGMQVMGIRIARLDGGPVSFSRATWRFFAQLLDVLTLGIGYLLLLFSARKQTLHDLVAGTVVVRIADAPAPTPVLRTAS